MLLINHTVPFVSKRHVTSRQRPAVRIQENVLSDRCNPTFHPTISIIPQRPIAEFSMDKERLTKAFLRE